MAQLTRVILDETIDAFVPEEDEELLREPRKVKKDSEPRNFIKDKLCDLGLADVSIGLYWIGLYCFLCLRCSAGRTW